MFKSNKNLTAKDQIFFYIATVGRLANSVINTLVKVVNKIIKTLKVCNLLYIPTYLLYDTTELLRKLIEKISLSDISTIAKIN